MTDTVQAIIVSVVALVALLVLIRAFVPRKGPAVKVGGGCDSCGATTAQGADGARAREDGHAGPPGT